MSRPPTLPRRLLNAPFRGSDAITAGLLTHRQLQGSSWRRLLHDIYVRADLRLDHLTWCRAVGLALHDHGAVSGRSAAFMWGVDILESDAPVEVIVPSSSRLKKASGVRAVRSTLEPGDVTRGWRGIPVTSPVRTAFDLARLSTEREAVVAVDALCHAGLTSVAGIARLAADRPGWRGLAQLRRVLDLADARAESPMETRLRLILIAGGLPRPEVQHEVRTRSGGFVARVDLAYPRARLAIEYDGDHHRDTATFRRDLARQNALIALGWTVLRLTAPDIYRKPDAVVRQVRALLES